MGGQHQEAYHYAAKHLQISKDTGDRMGQATAQLNLAELSKTLGYPEDGPPPPPMSSDQNDSRKNTASMANNQARQKPQNLECRKISTNLDSLTKKTSLTLFQGFSPKEWMTNAVPLLFHPYRNRP